MIIIIIIIIIIITIKDQIFTIPISLNSWSICSTPLFGKASRENRDEKDDGSNGANGKEPARTPIDHG